MESQRHYSYLHFGSYLVKLTGLYYEGWARRYSNQEHEKKAGKENGNLKREGKCTKSWIFLRKTSHINNGWIWGICEVSLRSWCRERRNVQIMKDLKEKSRRQCNVNTLYNQIYILNSVIDYSTYTGWGIRIWGGSWMRPLTSSNGK